ncbi:DNA repair protein XRCC4 [Humulus lupulus]|uniref:DNA repair protein XRCC4 n=1 Tax=Humulus lupulus TaxID=3486 RepID=UPI002B4123C4|nr:DNA repair protein XRCC4 [Humulus lupulus]
MEAPRHSCLKLELKDADAIFVKGSWFDSRFELFLTDGHHAWIFRASEEEVRSRAAQWDQPLSEYVALAERYLGFQQPDSLYGFADAGDGHKRLSWSFEKEGTKLQWRWKCEPAPDSKKTTAEILDFLMDANIRLSEEVVIKTQSFERLKVEAEKSLAQSEKISKEKVEFESALYAKFLKVLNSKKEKLRDLRDQLTEQGAAVGKLPQEEEDEFTDTTKSFDDRSDDEKSEEESSKNITCTLKDAQTSRPRGRKRTMRN